MKIRYFLISLFCMGFILSALQNSNAQSTTSSVEFKVRTSSPGGNYSPKNIGAIWIEDAAGNFIKTLKLWANRRKQYLYTWNSASGGNTTDAVTGATVTSHQTHMATWNVTDKNGNPVSDGNYTLKVEMTDRHAQGPLAAFDFPVGQPSGSLSLADETYFHDLELKWTSTISSVNDQDSNAPSEFRLYQNYPNPFNPTTTIEFALPQTGFVSLKIYNLIGEEITTLVSENLPKGNYKREWNASSLPGGIYVLRINATGFVQTRKMILLK